MEPDLKWVIGLAVGFFSTFSGMLIMAFRNLSARMSSGNKDIYEKIDDVKEKYVRRDDLDGHIKRLETGLKDLRGETRTQHQQVIQAITSLKVPRE